MLCLQNLKTQFFEMFIQREILKIKYCKSSFNQSQDHFILEIYPPKKTHKTLQIPGTIASLSFFVSGSVIKSLSNQI